MTAVTLTKAQDGDLGVMKAVQEGDRRAFDRLMREQGPWVRGVALSVLGDPDRVDDVAQQVWMTVWQRASELRDIERWKPWLYRLAYHAAIDVGRQASRQRMQSLPSFEEVRDPSSEGGEGVSEEPGAVLEAVLSLPAMYREPFVLRHVNGWSYQQIAEVMDIPVDTVETRLVRARRMLREMLQDKVR